MPRTADLDPDDLEKHTYLLRTTKDLWEAYQACLPSAEEYDAVFQQALIEYISDRHPDGEDAVPDHWLDWYEGRIDEMPRKLVTTERSQSSE